MVHVSPGEWCSGPFSQRDSNCNRAESVDGPGAVGWSGLTANIAGDLDMNNDLQVLLSLARHRDLTRAFPHMPAREPKTP